MKSIDDIHHKFAQHLSTADFIPRLEAEGQGGTEFGASNRLFTTRKEAPTEQDNPFSYGLDPFGHIARRKTSELIHAPANIVRYFKTRTDENK